EAQATREVRFCVEPSVYMPVAVKGSVSPLATLRSAEATAIEISTAGGTGSAALAGVAPRGAAIDDGPGARAADNAAPWMRAAAGLAAAQITWEVRFCVELSEYVPVAVKGSVSPLAMFGLAGVTRIE